MHPVKLKKPTWEDANRAVHNKNRGRIIRITYQPRETPRWKAQDKLFRPSERHVDRRSQMRKCMNLDSPYTRFIN